MFKKLCMVLALAISVTSFSYEVNEKINGIDYKFDFKTSPKRAVSMSQFTTEMLLKLGLEKDIVGTAFLEEEIYPSVAPSYNNVKVIADKWPNLETLLAVKPDFVTGWEVALKKGVDSKLLASHGIKLFVPRSSMELNANLDTLFDDFIVFGNIFEIQDKAQKYVNSQKEKLANIQKNYKMDKGFTYFLYDSGTDKAFTVFEGFTTNLLKMINGTNVLANKGVEKTWGQTSWEPVINANPEYIIIVDYSKGIREETDANSKIEFLKNNAITKNLKAVKENKFMIVKLADIVPGIRNIDFLEKVSKKAYEKK